MKSFLEYQRYNPEFLNNYLKYNRFIIGKPESTVNETYLDLRTFFRYVKIMDNKELIEAIEEKEFRDIKIYNVKIEDLRRVTSTAISNYISFLSCTLKNEAKTRNRKLTSIRKFYKYLFDNNHISINPVQKIVSAKVEERCPKYLNLEESKKLLSKTINTDKKFKIRNYAITCLFLNCSIRLNELVQINLVDVKLDDMTIKVKGKGNKERILYLNKATFEALKEYLYIRPNLPKTNLDYNALFISGRNKRMSRRTVQQIIDEELLLLFNEKKKGYHTHTLRHSSATLMYEEADIDIIIIKNILGHASLATTGLYTHISDKKMKEIMENHTISSIIKKMEALKNGN
ncbi:MAG: tyrosine-type recombinase/integrase [Clostridia bacterium]